MNAREQDAVAEVIRQQWAGCKSFADPESGASAQRAISRLAQALADEMAYGFAHDGKPVSSKFDRPRFVRKCGFGHLDGF